MNFKLLSIGVRRLIGINIRVSDIQLKLTIRVGLSSSDHMLDTRGQDGVTKT